MWSLLIPVVINKSYLTINRLNCQVPDFDMYMLLARLSWENYYLSNCMLPPLASTSCTDMLIPLLLLMNGLLFVVHEFELKRQHFHPCIPLYSLQLLSRSIPSFIALETSLYTHIYMRICVHSFLQLTQVCMQVSQRRRVSGRCILRYTT